MVEYSPRLSPKEAELFYHHVVRLLFASKRTRSDIQVGVAIQCKQAKSPTKQNYRKLRRVISYLKQTVHLPLVIGADNSGTLTWNIDASFVVHSDSKSHTGVYLTLGHGSMLSLSSKQHICTKSKTETELVRVDDTMTFVMCIKHFFESQVRYVNLNSPLKPLGSEATIKQDNMSVVQLERNG